MSSRALSLIAAAALLAAACEDLTRPEDPVWGKQPCAHCKMVLSEPHHAAQLATSSGERLYFDDIGCLAAHLDERGGAGRAWVRIGSTWSDAFAARYVAGARTPMGFGFAASEQGAHDFAAVRRSVKDKLGAGAAP